MKKDKLYREPMHVYVHAEVESLLNVYKRVFPGKISCWHPLCLLESCVFRGTDRLDRSNVRVMNGSI